MSNSMKPADTFMPVTNPFLFALTNVFFPGFGTCLSACINAEGFNGKALALGLGIMFIALAGIFQWPFMTAVGIFCMAIMFFISILYFLACCWI